MARQRRHPPCLHRAPLHVAPDLSPRTHIYIIVEDHRASSATVHGVREALDALDARMAALPQLRRVDCTLVPSMRRAEPRDGATDSLADVTYVYLGERHLAAVACIGNIRTLDFASRGSLSGSMPLEDAPARGDLLTCRLRRL